MNEDVISRGDILYLYTDGITEAINPEKQLYGENRLIALIGSMEEHNVRKLCAGILSDVDLYAGDEPQLTILQCLDLNLGSERMVAVKYGRDMREEEFNALLALDIKVYGEGIIAAEGLALKRFLKFKDGIVSVYSGGSPAGFACFYNVDRSVMNVRRRESISTIIFATAKSGLLRNTGRIISCCLIWLWTSRSATAAWERCCSGWPGIF